MSQDRLSSVFHSVFGADLPALSDEDSPETLDGWDSVNHLNLMLALEAEFDVQFEADEIAELTSVGAIRKRLGDT
jgi:acyl carrier protein